MRCLRSGITIGSLFSGIGGLELGLERAGLGPVVWQIEIDKFCRNVLARHWPGAARYGDVTELTRGRRIRRWAARALEADCICGGFPCTDISDAGRREGITGEHSSLWREFARVVRLVRPRYVVVENVAALAHRGLGVVLGDLAACGYDAVWDCVPAFAVGAPHRRDRLFVVAWRVPDADRDALRIGAERGHHPSRSPLGGNPFTLQLGAALGDSTCTGRQGPTGDPVLPPGRCTFPPGPDDVLAWGRVPTHSQPALCRMADGLPSGLDDALAHRIARLRALGNAVVPQVAEVVGRVVLSLWAP